MERFNVAAAFCFSLLSSLALGAAVMHWHAPRQNRDVQLQTPQPGATLQVWHFLSADCDCSRRVATQLAQRHPTPASAAPQHFLAWRSADGAWRTTNPQGQALSHPVPAQGIRSVPWLLVLSAQGQPLYQGGYGPRNSTGEDILREIQLQGHAAARPVRGCSFGQSAAAPRTVLSEALLALQRILP